MKTILLCFTIVLATITVNAQKFEFKKEMINYGEITKGSNGSRIFEFTNVGDSPLIIKSIVSTCGCAIPKKPEKPIMPNEKGYIEVSYDTQRLGGFSKQFTIFSNAKTERKKLKIKGYITNSKQLVSSSKSL